MYVEKRGRSWAVVDRYGEVVSRHRTEQAALDESGTYRLARRRPRRVERVIVEERVVRRRRKRNPWAVESYE